MADDRALRDGWDFMSDVLGGHVAAQFGLNDITYETTTNNHIRQINEAVQKLADSINKHDFRNLAVDQFKGYVAEEWHAQTYNIDAVRNESSHRAWAVHSTELASPDIANNYDSTQTSLKYDVNASKSVSEQARFLREENIPKYHNQKRLVPSDQLEDALKIANRRANENSLTRPEIAKSYEETADNLVDRIKDDIGNESKPLTLKEAEKIAKEAKENKFDPENHGISKEEEIRINYLKNSLQAGISAATITALTQLLPEIYKVFDYLIKNNEISLEQVKKSGSVIITASGKSFVVGAIAYAVECAIQKGLLGEGLKELSPSIVGAIVSIILGTCMDSIRLALGKLSAKEMGIKLIDRITVSSGYLVAAKLGGIIAQAIGWKCPAVAYIFGTLIGSAIAAVYNFGKKKLLSLCIDTGFTCFGLVDQDYTVPSEILEKLGVDIIPVQRTEIPRIDVSKTQVQNKVPITEYETVELTVLRRGIIGINKIGYTM